MIISATLQAAENNKIKNNNFISQQPLSDDLMKDQLIATASESLKPALNCVSLGLLVISASAINQEPYTKTCCFFGGLGCAVLGMLRYGTIKDARKVCDR
ncbi:hypothetical protein K9K77_00370 [Candidatus Babeliales bacterium]|nr:hypothetical protein [Candidatus Babeliales bacterium]